MSHCPDVETQRQKDMEVATTANQQSAQARGRLANLGRELLRLEAGESPIVGSDIRQRLAEALSLALQAEETLRNLARQAQDELAMSIAPDADSSPSIDALDLDAAGPELLFRYFEQAVVALIELRAARDLLPRWEQMRADLLRLQSWRIPRTVEGMQLLLAISRDELGRGRSATVEAFRNLEREFEWSQELVRLFSLPSGERPSARAALDFCRRQRWLEDAVFDLLDRLDRGEQLASEPDPAPAVEPEPPPDAVLPLSNELFLIGEAAPNPHLPPAASPEPPPELAPQPGNEPILVGEAANNLPSPAASPGPPPETGTSLASAESSATVDLKVEKEEVPLEPPLSQLKQREVARPTAQNASRRNSVALPPPPPSSKLTADEWRARIQAPQPADMRLWDELADDLPALDAADRKGLIQVLVQREDDQPPLLETRRRLLAILLSTLPGNDDDFAELVALFARLALLAEDSRSAYVAAASLALGVRSPHLPHPIVLEILAQDSRLLEWVEVHPPPNDLVGDDRLLAAMLVATLYLRTRRALQRKDAEKDPPHSLLPWFVDVRSERYGHFCRLLPLLCDESIDWQPAVYGNRTETPRNQAIGELEEKMHTLAKSAQPYKSPGGRATFSVLQKNAWRILRWIQQENAAPGQTPRPALRLFMPSTSVEDHLLALFEQLRDEGVHDQEQILKGDRAHIINWLETLAPAVANVLGASNTSDGGTRSRQDVPSWEVLESEQRRMAQQSPWLGRAAERLLLQLQS